MKKWYRDLIQECKALGASEVGVEHIRRHPRLFGRFGERRFSVVVSGTPSSPVAFENVVKDVLRFKSQ